MELSHSFEKIGDRGAEILRKSSKDAEHKQRSTKRRLDEAIEKLDKFSPVAHQPSSSATEEEIANLRTYVEEVSAWIESIRPTAELMSNTGIPQDEEETPPDDRRIGHPPPSKRSSGIVDPDLVASLFERLAILEERVSGVEGDRDDLERGQKTFIQQSIDERLPPGTFAAANESKARNEDIQTLKALSRLAGELKADGGELGSEVKGLQLSSSILEQQKILYAENTELKQRLSKVCPFLRLHAILCLSLFTRSKQKSRTKGRKSLQPPRTFGGYVLLGKPWLSHRHRRHQRLKPSLSRSARYSRRSCLTPSGVMLWEPSLP